MQVKQRNEVVLPTTTLLVAARLLRLEKSETKIFKQLISILQAHTKEQIQRYCEMETLIQSMPIQDSQNNRNQNPFDIATLLAILNCNGFTICTPEFIMIGTGLYPEAAIFNHSCEPNLCDAMPNK